MRSLAEFTYLNAKGVVVAGVVLLLLATPLAAGVFDQVESFDIADPDSEVSRAYEAYEAATGRQSEREVLLIVSPPEGAQSPAGAAAVAAVAGRLGAVAGIDRVATPSGRPDLVSSDGTSALVIGFLEADAGRVETGELVVEEFASDPETIAGGTAVAAHQIGLQSEDDARRIELYAAPILLLLCFLAFRSLLAAVLPLVLGAFSILITFGVLNGLTHVVDIDLFSLQVVTGLGVGLAIDYSLYVSARYRSEIRRGKGYRRAHSTAMSTAGRTVAFSAMTVAAALAALILFPHQFLSSTGIAGGLVALLSGLAALTVLPALLALLGPRIDPGFEQADSPGSVPRDPLSGGEGFWRALPQRVMASPIPFAALGLLVMLAVASPGLGGHLTTPDARVLPQERSAKRAVDALAAGFPELLPTRMSVVVPATAERSATNAARAEVESLPGVVTVSKPSPIGGGPRYVVVTSSLDPLLEPAQDLLEQVRAAPWPEGTLIGGRAAELTDQRESISASAPLVIAVVVLTNLILVLLMVRSLVLPLLSLLLNVLTVAASYGIMVAVFENQGPAELLGTFAQEGIDISVPILAFAVVFGLSTDYGIFLFSRIAEARSGGMSDDEAVVEGIVRTGRLITASAVIFSVAVGAFVFSDLVIVKEFAVAVAVAVLLDATVVRGLLVPAALKMLGARAWWWPGGSRTRRIG